MTYYLKVLKNEHFLIQVNILYKCTKKPCSLLLQKR